MSKVRIGLVGLGGIAQKAYLPIVSNEKNWNLVGAFTPNPKKRALISANYRMQPYESIKALAKDCDAVFVHSSTETHYQVVNQLLELGVDVYVDKPLAANLSEAEKLVNKAEKLQRILMVGFNRRFAPAYIQAKQLAGDFSAMHIEKHRPQGIGPDTYSLTMLDDYLHLVDTVRWLAGDDVTIENYFMTVSTANEMIYGHHTYQNNNQLLTSAMHRQAGVDLEKLEFITDSAIVKVWNMRDLEINRSNKTTRSTPGSWQTVGEIRGFAGAIDHFINCVQTRSTPLITGEEALKSQYLLQQMIDKK